jgi:FkbM family methyltransferase
MFRPSPRNDVEALARGLVSRRATRRVGNFAYNRLSLAQKAGFYALFAKMFRGQPQPLMDDEWRVELEGASAVLPLRGRDAWLDWDLAVSMLGHEVEIKGTYLHLLRFRRPALFVDVGANYGLHSLFFLVHGVPTVSFEPNPACHDYFRALTRLNGAPGELQPVALGAEEGWADLVFPEGETWLGSSSPAGRDRLAQGAGRLTTLRVPQTTLDVFTRRDGRRPDLIKIDTEGNEMAVLEGAQETLRGTRPWVIFESWRDASRGRVFDLLTEAEYRIAALPYSPQRPGRPLDRVQLLEWPQTNFIALPAEHLSGQ